MEIPITIPFVVVSMLFDWLYQLARLSKKAMRGCVRTSKAPAKPSKSCYRMSGAVLLESEASSHRFLESETIILH
jgi:hypothetical protein